MPTDYDFVPTKPLKCIVTYLISSSSLCNSSAVHQRFRLQLPCGSYQAAKARGGTFPPAKGEAEDE